MSILDTLKIPELSPLATHKLSAKTIFVPCEKDTPAPKSDSVSSEQILSVGEEIILVEEGIGYKFKWARVIRKDLNNKFISYGFTLFKNLVPLENIKPSISFSTASNDLLPDDTAKKIDWKESEINKVVDDKYYGNYFVHFDTGVQDFSNKETLIADIKSQMSLAVYSGSQIILDERGKDGNVKSLQDSHYMFAKAESIYFPVRPCSTLRVLVTVPKRYIEDLEDKKVSPFDDISKNIDINFNITASEATASQAQRYTKISFNNYTEYFNFLLSIDPTNNVRSLRVDLESADAIFSKTTWTIDPQDVNLNIKNEISSLKNFSKKIDDFILSNVTKDNEYIKVLDHWQGKLDLIFDKQDLVLTYVEFYDVNQKKLLLIKGIESFLKDNDIANKTIINYIIKKNEDGESFSKEIFDTTSLGGALKSFLAADLESGNIGGPLINFLTKYHYPKVNNLVPQPLNLADCVKEEAQIIKDIYNNKYNKVSEQATAAAQNLSLEDQLVQASAVQIKDKNLRIILGLDKQDASGTEYGALNRVLAAMALFDIDKFIAAKAADASSKINVQDYNEIVEKYQKAKKLLDAVTFAAACNPYVTKSLKSIQAFQLPALPIYNPNKKIADDLINLVVKIINEVVVLIIKERLNKAIQDSIDKIKNNFLNDISDKQNSIAAEELERLKDNFQDESGTDQAILNELNTEEQNQFKQSNPSTLSEESYDIRSFIDDVTCVISLQELCRLFNGRSVNDEVIDLIKSIVNNKHQKLKPKLSTKTDILNFFKKLGTKIDPEFCQSIEELNPQIPINPLCDDGTLDDARRRLLEDKGLSPEIVDDLLNDIKDKEKKNFEDLMKFLDGDPFDFSNVPSILCKTGPNGEKIPPTVDVTQPLASFNSMLETLMKTGYDAFDNEQEFWHQTTYSISSSFPSLNYNQNTGEITTPNISDTIERKEEPVYPIKNIITSSNVGLDTSGSIIITNFIDGDIQQQYDLKLISSQARSSILSIEAKLKRFISLLNFAIPVYLVELGVEQTARSQAFNQFYDKIRPFLVFAEKLQDASNNAKDEIDDIQLKLLFDGDNEKLAVYTALQNISENKSDFESLINTFNSSVNIGTLNKFTGFFAESNSGSTSAYMMTLLTSSVSTDIGLVPFFNTYKDVIKLLTKATANYPDFRLYFTGSSRIVGDKLYSINDVNIEKNSYDFFKYQSAQEVSEDVLDYIKNTLKINKEEVSKDEILQQYIKLKNNNLTLLETAYVKQYYKVLYKNIYENINKNISDKSSFLKNQPIKITTEVTTNDEGKKEAKTKTNQLALSTLLRLKIEQTPEQKVCKVRPHYLDLDSIRSDASKNKENTFCLEAVINEKIANNELVNTSELKDMETTDTEDIMLNAFHNAYIRTLLHDVVLRSISVFGYYDPQEIRSEQIYVDYLYDCLRFETKTLDNTYYGMLSAFYIKKYKQQNPNTDEGDQLIKEKIFKDIIKKELKDYVLPKLAKRILEDTNNSLQLASIPLINLYRFEDTYADLSNIYKKDKKVFLKTIQPTNLRGTTIFQEKDYLIFDEKEERFENSVEYKLFFELLFPLKTMLALSSINTSLFTMTRKSNNIVFNGTKKEFIRVAKSIQAKGQPIQTDLNNPQDVLNDGVSLGWFILKALLQTPPKIAKAFIEAADPNISFASKSYAAIHAVKPDIDSSLIPVLSFGAALFIPPTIFAVPYYLLGLWYEGVDGQATNKLKYLEKMVDDIIKDPNKDMDCSKVTNNDIVKMNSTTDYYEDPKKEQSIKIQELIDEAKKISEANLKTKK